MKGFDRIRGKTAEPDFEVKIVRQSAGAGEVKRAKTWAVRSPKENPMRHTNTSWLAMFLVASLVLATAAPALFGRGPGGGGAHVAVAGVAAPHALPRGPRWAPAHRDRQPHVSRPQAAASATGGAVATVVF